MPAVRLVTLADIFAEGDVGVVLDGDLVVVVDQDEVAELLVSGDRGRLAGHALLHVPVGRDAVDEVVEGALPGRRVRVEQAALPAGGHRHADRVADSLTERAGRGLHPHRVPALGVARRQRAPRPQRLQVVQLQSVARQVELDVEGQAGVARREHEAVPADPVRVGRVVPQHPLEQRVDGRGQAHGGAGMAVADLLHRVHRQHPDQVHRAGVELAPALRVRRRPGLDARLRRRLGRLLDGLCRVAACGWLRRGVVHAGGSSLTGRAVRDRAGSVGSATGRG